MLCLFLYGMCANLHLFCKYIIQVIAFKGFFDYNMRVLSVLSAGAETVPARFFVMCLISSSRLPEVFSTRITPAIYLCGLSPDCLRRLLSRSDCPWWGVSALCCRRQPGTARFFQSWCCSLFRLRFLQNAGNEDMQAAPTRSWRTLRLGYHREVVV